LGSGEDVSSWPVSDFWHWAPTGSFPFGQLNLGLFGYLERVVNVNPEVADGAFELAMTE
jgi:hypothetical protein